VNVFGADVRVLDVDAFLGGARVLFPFLALGWLALALRVRRAWWLLLGVVLANAYVWLVTTWPLQRLYALGPSSDRLNNLAMVQPVAAGHSPLYSAQVGHVQIEPLWSLLAAALSGFDPQRVLVLYAFLPLLMSAAVAVSLYAALRGWDPWERALVAGMATLLFSAPLDFTSAYRVPWAMTFLLKPNHGLGLVVAPWVAWTFATSARTRDRVAAALLLHLLGWVFAVHMAIFCVGLAAFAALSLAADGKSGRRDATDVAVVIGLNLLAVSPYLFLLTRGFDLLDSGPRHGIPPSSAHVLEAVTRMPWLFALGAWGAWAAWKRDRLGRVWAGQLVGAGLVWLAYLGLGALEVAKELDDVYYWFRFVLAVCGGIGLWDLSARIVAILPAAGRATLALARPHARAAALAALLLPATIPYWYDPARMDLYFAGSREPIPDGLQAPIAALLAQGDRVGVLAGDPTVSRWAAALGGFRVLVSRDFPQPSDYPPRIQLQLDILGGQDLGRGRELARDYGVTHLIVTPELLYNLGVTSLDALERRADLREIHFSGDRRLGGRFVAVFEIAAGG
jgi:hypothetical protein